MSTFRNSIFSGVVPIAEQPRPTAAKSGAQPSAVPASTGSALLDSFAADAEQKALFQQAVLTQQLTSLSFELQRISGRDTYGRDTYGRDTHGRDTHGRDTIRPAIRATIGHIEKNIDKTVTLPTTQSTTDLPKGAAQITAQIKSQPIDSQKAGSKNPAAVSTRQKVKDQKEKGKRATEQVENNPVAHNQAAVRQPAAQVQKPSIAVNPLAVNPQSTPQLPSHAIARPPARPQQTNPQVKVYGGSSYKALQAKAAAGGLVNLDDTLLFGGVEHKKSKSALAAQPLPADTDFASYLSHPIEDFTASPIPGGIHFTAHLSETAREGTGSNSGCDRAWHQTVLNIEIFKLSDLTLEDAVDLNEGQIATSDNTVTTAMEADPATENPTEFNDLGQQVTYLTQRIDYLSKKLAELITAEMPNRRQPPAVTPADHNRSPAVQNPVVPSTVLLGIEALQLSQLSETAQRAEKRVATLDSLFHMPRLT